MTSQSTARGFFKSPPPGGERLTRAGQFMTNNVGTLVTMDNFPVLDDGGGEIQIPIEVNTLAISGDGTISADGVELAKLGVVRADPLDLQRRGDNLWETKNGVQKVENTKVMQGFVEDSNVQPVIEIARMIEVQRFYDAGQKLLDLENERIRKVITTMGQLT